MSTWTPDPDGPRSEWARRYVERGLAVVGIPPGEKGPRDKGWQRPGGQITDAAKAEAFWTKNPEHNMGVVLGASGICSLDVDDVPAARQVLWDLLGLDLDALPVAYPTVVGNPARFRVMFRVPEGVELSRHSLNWPNENDPDGSKLKLTQAAILAAKERGDKEQLEKMQAQADSLKRFTVFELRAGQVQDVLPPSIHPGTGKPYTWRKPPSGDGLPVLPNELLSIWQNWDIFKRDAEADCPWAPQAPAPKKAAKPKPKAPGRAGSSRSVIDAFNQAHDVESLLAAHGYTQRGKKWLCPHSSTGLPGVTISEGRVYSHHGSDPLANDHQNDAFDVFCILDHNGNQSEAVKAAARLLGIEREPRREEPPPEGVPREAGQQPPVPQAPPEEPEDSLPCAPSLECGPEAADLPGAPTPGGAGGFRISEQELLQDFVVIYGTDTAWDRKRARLIKLSAIREAVGRTRYKWWQESEHRQMAQDVVFDPTERCDPVMLNLYDGFKVTPDPRGADGCVLIRKHLGLLCNNRADEYLFLLKWIAYPLQYPGAKMATAVVMFGAEGPGKSLLWEQVVRRIYGEYGTTIGQAQLESQFTGWQSRKLFALAEEVVSREEMRHYKGVLKHLVTGETLQINEKNMPVREEANHLNFVFLSNSTVPMALDDGDRRYLVLYVDRVPPAGYFQALVGEIESGGIEAFYHYLMNLDLTGFGPHSKPPLNDEKQALIDGSLAAPRYFVRRWMAGETEFPVTGAVTQADLWQAFCRWCEGANEFKRRERDFLQEAARDLLRERPDIRYPTDRDDFRTARIFVTPEFAASKAELGRNWAAEAGKECRKFGTHFNRRSIPVPGELD
ncbi:bifunctional DNA primase/polymerase [Pseudomonas sp. 273]|uniref:bifunctional DNA primase/polymerase n=1 Tax=Pseudomonas sp. 273 TaxID=75692 RepID=UPI0023D821E4|nr:bifunctional DNA primase/polymerase [Pseudomonas sp. 273]